MFCRSNFCKGYVIWKFCLQTMHTKKAEEIFDQNRKSNFCPGKGGFK